MSDYISFIDHLCRNNEKSNIRNALGAHFFSKVHICDAKIAYLDDIANLEILPNGLHFSEVLSITKLSKMSMGNICNWLS